MSFARRIYSQGDHLPYTPTVDTPAGTVVTVGALTGVTEVDIYANRLGALALEGVFLFPKATTGGSGQAEGTVFYWDPVNQIATVSPNNGATPPVAFNYLGKSFASCADGDATVPIRLHPF
jgi:predicted RecA/RadA family phage recombinase